MRSKSTFLFTSIILVLLAFAAGYYLGADHTRARLERTFIASMEPQIRETSAENVNDLGHPTLQTTPKIGQQEPSLDYSRNQQQTTTLISNAPVYSKDSSVTDLMTYLLEISASNEPGDMEKFGPTMDLLQEAIKQDPAKIELLMDYFLEADSDSRAPYYITNLLQGADIPDRDFILRNLVNRLSAIGSVDANTKLLHLVASTGVHYDNDLIINTVKNIALYGQRQDSNRVYALDLLMPFQLNEIERNKIVSDFTYALDDAPSDEKSFMIENIIRFSNKSQRGDLALDYLSDTNDFATRVAILSTLHNGSVSPNDTLKNQLFKIAQNQSDPLSEHAKNALLYVFEIDNAEYKQLKQNSR